MVNMAPHDVTADSFQVDAGLGLIPAQPGILVRVQPIAGKGRGVVAVNTIAKDSVVLCDAVERYSGEAARALRQHPLYQRLFVDPASYGCATSSDLLWAIGAISVLNHSDTPNCSVSWKATSSGEWALLCADQTIRPGEEILIRYTNIDQYEDRDSFL